MNVFFTIFPARNEAPGNKCFRVYDRSFFLYYFDV